LSRRSRCHAAPAFPRLGGALARRLFRQAGDHRAAGDRAVSTLEVRGVSLSFGGVQVLSNVDLSADAGEIVGIIGPNGAGKTTLLNVICGIHGPDRGEVVLEGVLTNGMKPSRIAALGLRRTFQTSQLFGGMTVFENMMAGLHLGTRASLFATALRTPAMRRE